MGQRRGQWIGGVFEQRGEFGFFDAASVEIRTQGDEGADARRIHNRFEQVDKRHYLAGVHQREKLLKLVDEQQHFRPGRLAFQHLSHVGFEIISIFCQGIG